MDMFEHMMQCSKSQEGRDVMEGPTTKAKLTGGTLFATYIMATEGRLPYNPVISYTDNHDEVGEFELRAADISFLETIKESMLVELDCQVCSNLLLHPLTTPCGHTFCRSCIMRAFDLAPPCPVCRRPFNLPSGANTSYTPVNKCLRAILQNLYPSKTAARKAVEADSTRNPDDLDTPIFVCTVAFPNMPTYLHIFESRYRLLIRRAMESGRQQAFGMVLFSPGLLEQHELGSVDFCQYGTMLRIVNQQLLPDGRSMIETRGEWRFKVIRHGMRDEYRIAKVERIDDISIAEEEELEAMEVGLPVRRGDDDAEMCFEPSDGRPLSQFHDSATLNSQYNPNELSRFRLRPPGPPDLRSLPTTALLQICGDFVARMRERIAPWLHENIIGLPHIFGK